MHVLRGISYLWEYKNAYKWMKLFSLFRKIFYTERHNWILSAVNGTNGIELNMKFYWGKLKFIKLIFSDQCLELDSRHTIWLNGLTFERSFADTPVSTSWLHKLKVIFAYISIFTFSQTQIIMKLKQFQCFSSVELRKRDHLFVTAIIWFKYNMTFLSNGVIDLW